MKYSPLPTPLSAPLKLTLIFHMDIFNDMELDNIDMRVQK